MKRKAVIPLVLGLGIGLVTVRFLVNTIRTAQASNRSVNTVTVVRAKQDINAYEPITPEKVEVLSTADSLLAPANGRIGSMDELKDRVAAKAIPAGAAVLKAMLAPEGTPPGLVGRIPAGFRAVSVKIDEVSGVAYQIKPGDWVDVIVVMDIDAGARGKKETIAEVILQHVQVAAIGHTTTAPGAEESTSKVKPAKSVTLLVPEMEVPKLHLAGTRGKLTLAMRGEDGQTSRHAASATLSDVLAGMNPQNQAPDAPGANQSPSLMGALFGTFGRGKSGADAAQSAEPPVPEDERMGRLATAHPPHTVLVRHGSTLGDKPAAVEQITFEHAESSRIIEATKGLPTRAAATLKGTHGIRGPQEAGPQRDTSFSPAAERSDNVKEEQSLPDDDE
jgi:pilus assembly protein CpaB